MVGVNAMVEVDFELTPVIGGRCAVVSCVLFIVWQDLHVYLLLVAHFISDFISFSQV